MRVSVVVQQLYLSFGCTPDVVQAGEA